MSCGRSAKPSASRGQAKRFDVAGVVGVRPCGYDSIAEGEAAETDANTSKSSRSSNRALIPTSVIPVHVTGIHPSASADAG